jgi:hypothetical protein
MGSQEEHTSIFTAALHWCCDRCGSTTAWARRSQSIPDAGERPQPCRGPDTPPLPRYFFDASLLFRCMDMLDVDRSDLERDDPLLFRELQGVCALCRSKQECWQDLAHDFDDGGWNKWWLYCPNSAMLVQIGTVYEAAHTPRLDMPRSSGLPFNLPN